MHDPLAKYDPEFAALLVEESAHALVARAVGRAGPMLILPRMDDGGAGVVMPTEMLDGFPGLVILAAGEVAQEKYGRGGGGGHESDIEQGLAIASELAGPEASQGEINHLMEQARLDACAIVGQHWVRLLSLAVLVGLASELLPADLGAGEIEFHKTERGQRCHAS